MWQRNQVCLRDEIAWTYAQPDGDKYHTPGDMTQEDESSINFVQLKLHQHISQVDALQCHLPSNSSVRKLQLEQIGTEQHDDHERK